MELGRFIWAVLRILSPVQLHYRTGKWAAPLLPVDRINSQKKPFVSASMESSRSVHQACVACTRIESYFARRAQTPSVPAAARDSVPAIRPIRALIDACAASHSGENCRVYPCKSSGALSALPAPALPATIVHRRNAGAWYVRENHAGPYVSATAPRCSAPR